MAPPLMAADVVGVMALISGMFGRDGTSTDTFRGLHACKAGALSLEVTTGGVTGEE